MKKKVFTNEDGVYAIKQYIDGTHEGKLFFNAKMVTQYCTKLYKDIDKKEIHSVIKYCLDYLADKECLAKFDNHKYSQIKHLDYFVYEENETINNL